MKQSVLLYLVFLSFNHFCFNVYLTTDFIFPCEILSDSKYQEIHTLKNYTLATKTKLNSDRKGLLTIKISFSSEVNYGNCERCGNTDDT